jgi:uncharacterized protein with ParB-like and HNH nuclease domain
MDAGKRTINDIFNGNRILEIPFFQRAYVWGEDQWERLLEDLKYVSKTNKPYFLGSVILKQKPTSSTGLGDLRTVIDGQQRLTTLNIFFKVLCLKQGIPSMFDRIFRLMSTNKIALLHNHMDIVSFEKVLNLNELNDIEDTDNITGAYQYFKEYIVAEDLDIQNILLRVLFVGIDLDSSEDEQQIFDTINSLGVKLTTAELLKNYFFNREDLKNYDKYWKDIFEKDKEQQDYWDKEITTGRFKRTFIDLFFYAYLQIKIQEDGLEVTAEDKTEFAKVDTLFESYKKFIKEYKVDKNEILVEITEYATLFHGNFDYDVIDSELTPEYGIERINAIIWGLETTTLLPYALYILKNVSHENEQNELFETIESYLMRRMVVHLTTKNYNQLFSERLISNEILTKDEFISYINRNPDNVNYFPNNAELKDGFDKAYLVNKQSAGILYMIESKIRNHRRQATKLLGMSKYSLEHLMPKKWENNWGKISSKELRDIRNRKLLTLGNLTIITQSLNASIRDSNWKTKKKGKQDKPGLLQYAAGIETLAPYLELEEWNESEIEKRAKSLYNKAVKIWKYDDGELE